ncbi:hypothetical protein XENOCAPTIV_013628 [Xenoophorus captivus]|uniref:Ras-GAP domain-containing protein n=1 Tax=Xenoophorus captivus TaxID=1517983 RepID=A0ABV0RAG4_9TELE
MFLRFINPAIVSPYEAGILDKKPLPRVERGLKLMSKRAHYIHVWSGDGSGVIHIKLSVEDVKLIWKRCTGQFHSSAPPNVVCDALQSMPRDIALLGRLGTLPVLPLQCINSLSEVVLRCFVGLRISRFKGSSVCCTFSAYFRPDLWFLVGVSADGGFWHNYLNALSYIANDRICVLINDAISCVCKCLPIWCLTAVL